MRRRTSFLSLLVAFISASIVQGQESKLCTDGPKGANNAFHMVPCNGISVGIPKVFDNRTLTLLLEKLKKQLDKQQSQNGTIDLKAVTAALNNLQGLSQQETSTAFSVSGSPTPATSLSNTLNTGIVDSNGNPLPNTTSTQGQSSNASVTSTAPGFDSFAALPAAFNPTFGQSATDLLENQVDLSYQIINLQMLLDRALSDRIYPATAQGNTRLQTVLGFNVTLDPPRTANDAVAVVEVTLKPIKEGKPSSENLSLVALMPQEKTYNAAALNSHSNAFSGAAMAGAFQVGGAVRKRAQVFYLYKDVDTISYERMTADGTLVFGWMFRPVLGRRSVPPGFKQLFAVLALPQKDCAPTPGPTTQPAETTSASAGPQTTPANSCAATVTPTVRTFWKKYDRNTQTSFQGGEANRAREVWYGMSLGTARPQLFGHHGYENHRDYDDIRIASTTEYQKELTPTVAAIAWRPTGVKTATISVKGNNFFTDTQVLLGDTRYSESAGNMAVKSDQSFELTSTLDQVANASGVIEGRYGLSTPLVNNGPANCGVSCAYGVTIDYDQGVILTDSVGGSRRLTLTLQAIPDPSTIAGKTQNQIDALRELSTSALGLVADKSLTSSDSATAPGTIQSPIISVNGTAVPFPYDIASTQVKEDAATANRIQISAQVPDTLLTDTSAAIIRIAWPFYDPARWSASIPYSPADGQFKVTRVSDNTMVLSRVNDLAFVPDSITTKHCWSLIASDNPVPFGTQDCTPKPEPSKASVARASAKATKGVKRDPSTPPTKVTALPSGVTPIYSFLFTLPSKLPSKAVLVSSDGVVYHLTIPDSTDKKDDTTKITTLQQYDSAWIDITFPSDKVPVMVETNGTRLRWRIDPPDPKAKPETPAAAKKDKTLHVEITRAQTAKPGLLDVRVFDKAKAQIAKQQIRITCTLCGDGGNK